MILVFIVLGIVILLSIIVLLIVLSSIKIRIVDFKLNNFKIDKGYKMFIQLYLLNRFKVLTITINNKRINRLINSKQLKRIGNMDLSNISDKDLLDVIKKIDIHVQKLDLNIDVGFDEAHVTACIIPVIATIISIIISRITKSFKSINDSVRYNIEAVYNKNIINIKLDGILNIKIVHIIYMLYILVKKGRDKNGRTSNRRTYVSSHGFN